MLAEVLKEVLAMLIYLGIVTLIPIVILGIRKGINALVQYLSTKTDNAIIHEVLTEIGEFVADAVSYTMQTYVDSLKKEGKFNKEAQNTAFNLAYETALQFISEESKDLFESVYGDLDEYLRILIESKVNELKVVEPYKVIELEEVTQEK